MLGCCKAHLRQLLLEVGAHDVAERAAVNDQLAHAQRVQLRAVCARTHKPRHRPEENWPTFPEKPGHSAACSHGCFITTTKTLFLSVSAVLFS